MKASISKSGDLTLIPTNETEYYALDKWYEEYVINQKKEMSVWFDRSKFIDEE